MFVISKFLSYLILPPGLWVIGFIALIILIRFKLFRWIWGIALFLLISIYALSIAPGRDLLIRPLEDKYSALEKEQLLEQEYDAIVILGAGMHDFSPDYSEKPQGGLGSDGSRRVMYGFYLYKENPKKIIVSGGRTFGKKNETTEAEIMKKTLLSLGVLEQDVYMEKQSQNTDENLKYVQKYLDDEGMGKILLVTSAYHMPRSMKMADKYEVGVIAAPTDYKTDREGYTFFSFMPAMGYLQGSVTALREWVGLGYYGIKN